ncbi:MAG: GtrA family protein [Myxococcales bacterium]|nr:GtrA family protein [Myxococcales bacterium]
MRLPAALAPLFSARFIKFAAVGASGVVVNLGALALLRAFDVKSTVASALAIQISIVSNFVINDRWTFRDHDTGGSALQRALRFQAVSLVGAVMQWIVFILGNIAALRLIAGADGLAAWWAGAPPGALGVVTFPVTHPPEVGGWIYVSQLLGIGVATGWNFLANFWWTWRERPAEGQAPS